MVIKSLTHIGSTNLVSSNSTFQLNNVLCAPKIKQNLLSVSQFCYQNNTSIDFFFPDYCVIKDLSTGTSLIQGPNKGHVYEWPSSSNTYKPIHAFHTTKSIVSQRHSHLLSPYLCQILVLVTATLVYVIKATSFHLEFHLFLLTNHLKFYILIFGVLPQWSHLTISVIMLCLWNIILNTRGCIY